MALSFSESGIVSITAAASNTQNGEVGSTEGKE
jgi:hypothetical protein